jgi:ABC-type transport system involved in multi-copper enzyme maturation permease subunit
MSARTHFYVTRWLMHDTLCQARASGIFWFMLAVSFATILFCLTATVAGAGPDRLDMAFGAVSFSSASGLPGLVRSAEVQLASGVADVVGLLLALLWTAGFLPAFLEPAVASVLLAKPVPRWVLLAGKIFGVLAFVAIQAALFVGGTWLALGLRTGVWDFAYFLCIPLLVLHFAVFFSFSAMLAVATRSTVACVFGSLLFWGLCWGMNFGRHAAQVIPDLNGLSPALAMTTEIGYWVMPKPFDFHLLLSDGLQPGGVFARLVSTQTLAEHGAWSPLASVLASLAAALVLLGVASYEFLTADY